MDRDAGIRTALTIAGSDPSGGAGLQMDLKCFAALGVHGCSAVTAVTVQNTASLRSVLPLEPKLVRDQLDAVYDDFRVDAVKTGMLYEASIVEVVAAKVAEEGTPLVVDPVLEATAGGMLSRPGLADALKERLLPKARLVTPNLPEAAELTGIRVQSDEGMRHACLDLYQLGCESVLLKGGHLSHGPANDLFYDGSFRVFEGERLDRKVHGTGCMLSAFITALAAKGVPVADAVGLSKRFVTEAIRFSEPLGKGRSIGNPLTTLQNSAQRYHVLAEVFRWTGALEEVLPVALIPETGANLAFALPFAASVDDVCSLDGRLARAGKSARRVGFPAFGTPEPVASAVLAAMRSDRRVRSALNLRHSKPLLDLCRTLGLKIGEYDPAREPKDSASTVEWGAGAAIRALGFVPDIISGEGAHGREPMMLVLGEYPQQVVDKLGRIVTGLKER